jgi:hypothetical protein
VTEHATTTTESAITTSGEDVASRAIDLQDRMFAELKNQQALVGRAIAELKNSHTQHEEALAHGRRMFNAFSRAIDNYSQLRRLALESDDERQTKIEALIKRAEKAGNRGDYARQAWLQGRVINLLFSISIKHTKRLMAMLKDHEKNEGIPTT